MNTNKKKFSEILVVSVGVTPQIITETLWYYTYEDIRKFDRIFLLTTSIGKDKIITELYDNGWLKKLEKALSVSKGTFVIDEKDIIVLSDIDGNELEDIRTSKDSEDMMMHVFSIMKDLTNDPNERLTIVIAGGRKTMPATLALAASIYGRRQDEMVHVMVNDDLFWKEDWFFPTDPKDNQQEIEISKLPYLRMKNFITGINVENPLEAVSITQARLDELSPLTKVKIAGSRIIVDGNEYRFPPAEMQLWRFMARKKLEHCVREDLEFCGSCNECFSTQDELRDEFDNGIADEYFQIVKEGSASWDTREEQLEKRDHFEMDSRLRELKSKLKRNIRASVLDPRVYNQIQVIDEPINNDSLDKGSGFRVDKNALSIDE